MVLSFNEACGNKNGDKDQIAICKSGGKIEYPYTIHLPDKVEEDLTTSMFAGEVQYIPLETTKESLLGNVLQTRMNDSIIVISDRHRLLLFGRDGTFRRQIGKSGKGPGEYNLIYDFELYGDTVYLTSRGKNTIIRYTLDGKFQGELMPGNILSHFGIDTKGQIVWYNYLKDELQFYNMSMKLTIKFSPDNLEDIPGFYVIWDDFNTYFQISNDKLLLTSYFNDTIWNVDGGTKKAVYVFDIGDKLLQRKVLVKYDGNLDRFLKTAAENQKINILENKHNLYIFRKTWTDNDLNAIYIHNFKSCVTKKYSGPYVYDDLVGGLKLKIESEMQCSSNSIISFINAMNLQEKLEKEDTQNRPEGYSTWEKRMRRVKFDDNPVLVIMKLK